MHHIVKAVLVVAGTLALSVAQIVTAQERAGTPLVGQSAISETTDSIMVRQATSITPSGIVLAPRLRLQTFNRLPNPNALPDQPSVPAAKFAAVTPKVAQTQSYNFLGAKQFDSIFVPPDTMGAVGPSQFIVAINGRIRSFDKLTGTPDSILDVTTDIFFQSVKTPLGGGVTSNFASDPHIRYDRGSQRWYVVMIDTPDNGAAFLPNRVMLAVSSTPVITTTTVWNFFFFNPSSAFVDYPTLGIDNNAIYIGANIFNLSGTAYINADAYVVKKSSVQGSGPISVTLFNGIIPNPGSCTVPADDGAYTPQGVDNANTATEGYFIGVSFCFFSKLIVNRVSNPGGVPTLSPAIAINTAPTLGVGTSPHLGNTGGANGNLDASDTRLISGQVRGGNLYAAHAISVDSTGVATGSAAVARNGIRWYRINALTTTPVVAEFGTVFDNTNANPQTTDVRWFSYPGIQVNGQGNVAIGFTASGPQQRANGGFTGRLASDAPGTTDAPTIFTNALQAYNPSFDSGGPNGRRWGDFSYTSVDPNDDQTMWTIQEYTESLNSWGVRVSKLLAPPPPSLTALSVSSIPAGTASTTLTITGTSSGGSAFFDPGPGFPNRLQVEILPGVTVTGVTVTDPTHLSVTVSTVGASVGEKAVRVVNPDGQTVTGPVILTVTGTASPTISSANSLICAVASPCNFTFQTVPGPAASTFGVTGTLPSGMSFANPSLSGTPAAGTQGTYTLTVTASNGTLPDAVQTFKLIVTASCGGFTDVTGSDIFCNSTDWLKNRGVTLGCTATQYCPNDPVTRAQMALFMQRLGDVIAPNVFSDNVQSPGALNLDTRPNVCTTAIFPPVNFPRVAYVNWTFQGYAQAPLVARVWSRVSFDGGYNYATDELNLMRVSASDRNWVGTSATVKVNIPAGSGPRFQLKLDREAGTLASGNFSATRCNIGVLFMSVNGGASPYDSPTIPGEVPAP